MTGPVSFEATGEIAVITADSPPVNALGQAVRVGLMDAFQRAAGDAGIRAIVLTCAGRTFFAGADISEFDKPLTDPWLPDVVAYIESLDKPVVAALFGTALGGGLEVALACHYRVAVPGAKVGLPEVTLGILPGASGTQRMARLVGPKDALDVMISGKPVGAKEALAKGIIDQIVDGDLRAGAIAYARELLARGAGPRRISATTIDKAAWPATFFAEYRQSVAAQTRGYFAPERIIRCVEAAVNLPYAEGLEVERKLFEECKNSVHSKSMRHLFFAEREVGKVADVPRDTAKRPVAKVGIIGAGTMGGGIAMNFANAGVPVTLIEANQEGLDRGLGIVRKNYEGAVKKGRMSEADLAKRMGLLSTSLDYGALADADLVIEAVFENMALKKEVFTKLDATCKAGAILASNTSSLDVDAIAAATGRPEDVIGLHFFSPANVMVLLEIVRGAKTGKDVIATAMELAKGIRKVGVLVGNCFGFVGNRMFFPYVRESQRMLLEGMPAEYIDRIAYDWGMAMGPCAVMDLSGLDVFQKLFSEWRDKPDDPAFCRVLMALVEQGRLGQKTGAGIFRYDGRKAVPDPEVAALAASEAARLGVAPVNVSDEEIIERLFFSMINEGALILAEGIAQRPGDIDVVFANGYGFPRYRGGPMFYADTLGLQAVYAGICRYRDRYGDQYWTPAPLLEELARAGSSFAAWHAGR
ncbi:MAG: enoyl-CoA hydratase/isomerase family protein [Gammaproteobacteria bacterium]|nr:enoyl-CoA hydratase/isomerase family protein [Gammaproteobacteria bacterium]